MHKLELSIINLFFRQLAGMQMHCSLQARNFHPRTMGSHCCSSFPLQPNSLCITGSRWTCMALLGILPCSYVWDRVLHSSVLVDLIDFQCRCHDKWWQICPINQIKNRIAKLIWLIIKRINPVWRLLQGFLILNSFVLQEDLSCCTTRVALGTLSLFLVRSRPEILAATSSACAEITWRSCCSNYCNNHSDASGN